MIRKALGIFRKVVIVLLTLGALATGTLWLLSYWDVIIVRDTRTTEYPLVDIRAKNHRSLPPGTYVTRGLLSTAHYFLVDHSQLHTRAASECGQFRLDRTCHFLDLVWFEHHRREAYSKPPDVQALAEKLRTQCVFRVDLRLPMWAPFSLLAIYPALAFIRGPLRRRRRRLKGLCLNCAYDLRGTPKRCPECGREVGVLLSSNG